MRLFHAFAFLLVLLGIGGCVSAPEGVAPSFVDPAKYAHYTCAEVTAAKQEATVALANLSEKQSGARARGIAYNLLLIPGAGALAKDRAGEIGVLKGELLALESALRTCSD